MKCPKCHYLSFDPEPRCRNCGFTLAIEEADLPLVRPAITGPERGDIVLDDAPDADTRDDASDLIDPLDVFEPAAPMPAVTRDGIRSAPTRRLPDAFLPSPETSVRPVVTTELPLFVKDVPSPDVAEAKVIPMPPPESPKPVPVTRVAPALPREKRADHRKLGPLDDDLLDVLNRLDRREKGTPDVVRDVTDRARRGQRLGAALVDTVCIGAVLASVVAVTLRWSDLAWAEWTALPMLPISAFLLMLLLGYRLLFTAFGGQSPGKMAFGIRVVDAGETGVEALSLGGGQALYREVIAVPAILAFGIGFLPALVGEGRAVHDRLAATRVIRS